MLYQLGAVQFDVAPLNTDSIDRSAATDFVPKDVIGRRPPLEAVGEGEETIRLSGRIFPKTLGGLGDMEALDLQRVAGFPLPLMRGDGMPMGFFVIETLTQRSSRLDGDGVGRIVDFDLVLKRAEPPGAATLASLAMSLVSRLFS
jgi:phage protein U